MVWDHLGSERGDGTFLTQSAEADTTDAPAADTAPPVPDTQVDPPRLTTAAEALASIRLPDGYRAALFAAEPQVRQPIGLAWDPRGRLWIAENYSYEVQPNETVRGARDRIVVLEDSDGDDAADRRTIFADGFEQLTSVEVGGGGVWALSPPKLFFVPDADGDDRPDAAPQVVLDGFDVGAANRHNFANGLKWGPDGWLYGRNGITHEGRVGVPGTPADRRVLVGPGLWRYHPRTRAVEVVATGTTNPWGHDWDEHGELFFINTVIGHLWHAVPGSHLQRMFGVDRDPFVYELMEQTADHFHWDTVESWRDVRKGVSATTAEAGGGHAHSGLMIYLGDNWPQDTRGDLFTVNLHGHRLNRDHPRRQGVAFTAEHRPDFVFFDDPWFRGIELTYGPDGSVFVIDWSDVGECHEADGVHRGSGRIFKLTYDRPLSEAEREAHDAKARILRAEGLAALEGAELVRLQLDANDWWVRMARRVLQDRHERGVDLSAERAQLLAMLRERPETTRRLRALWCLQGTGGVDARELLELLEQPDEPLRAWAVRLLMDPSSGAGAALASNAKTEASVVSAEVRAALVRRASDDPSGLVLLYLASGLQRWPVADRWELASALARRADFAEDRRLALMLWYAVEPGVPLQETRALEMAGAAPSVLLRQLIARRMTHDLVDRPQAVGELLKLAAARSDVGILAGMNAALRGWRKAAPPPGWEAARDRLRDVGDEGVQRELRELAVVFGDGRAVDELRRMAVSPEQDPETRRTAIRTLVDLRAEGLDDLLFGLLGDQVAAPEAVAGLVRSDHPETPRRLMDRYGQLWPPAREALVAALASRPAVVPMLVEAIEQGTIDRSLVGVFQIRQMQQAADEHLRERLRQLWPDLRPLDEGKRARIAEWKQLLDGDALRQADRAAGRDLWKKHCATCHTLYGEGAKIGPDLTGAQRGNLDYLLENILDPSASLLPDYRMTTLELADGRVLNGVVLRRNDKTWEVQTPAERLVLPVAEIERSTDSGRSLMPEGLLDVLQPAEVAQLIGYLMAPRAN